MPTGDLELAGAAINELVSFGTSLPVEVSRVFMLPYTPKVDSLARVRTAHAYVYAIRVFFQCPHGCLLVCLYICLYAWYVCMY
jgi:hypothetical protein